MISFPYLLHSSNLPYLLDCFFCLLHLKNIMALRTQLLSLLIILLYIDSCYGSLQEEQLSNFLDETSGYDTGRAYPTYFGTIDDRDSDFEPKFRSLIEYDNEIFSLNRFDKVGSPVTAPKMVSVDDFGAKGDGADGTEAFKKAWKEACSSTSAVLVVPHNKNFLLKPITFSGPCKTDLTMKIYGNIEASDDQSDYENDRRHWIVFENLQNFLVEGGGTINGNGKIWWQKSCKINKNLPCKSAPTALTFIGCNNLRVQNMMIKDAQQMHLSFQDCVNVQAHNLMVTAPEKSPNTDGIHVTNTQNIQIMSCVIRTGDDCISIVSGSQKVQAMDITCGPGHGISIGSLGSGNSEAHVSDVLVDRAKLTGTTNGVRIKTWQGGSGSANGIKFQNIAMYNVKNPIIIDQNYCDQDNPCKKEKSAVQVRDVLYKNIKGTSASDVAIKFDCSASFPCQGIVLQDINLVETGGRKANASCMNINLAQIGRVSPYCPPEKGN